MYIPNKVLLNVVSELRRLPYKGISFCMAVPKNSVPFEFSHVCFDVFYQLLTVFKCSDGNQFFRLVNGGKSD
jgi:hypothetical protein